MPMTNQEYLLKSLLGCGVPQETIDLMLLKENLPPQGEVSIGDCDLAMYKHFSLLLSASAHKVAQGDFSQSWNLDALKEFYTALCYELNKPNVLFPKPPKPTLHNRSYLWWGDPPLRIFFSSRKKLPVREATRLWELFLAQKAKIARTASYPLRIISSL